VYSCTPDSTKWKYPAKSEATGILARVLRTGKLRVAGVQWSAPNAADYKTDPLKPTGFWPGYMAAITEKMAKHYEQTITLERVYYKGSGLVVDAVAKGEEVDMSEPYYYLSGFHGTEPRIESLAFSCVTAGLASKFYTKKGGGITSVDKLYDRLVADDDKYVGFIASGNYDAVSSLLPDSTMPQYKPNSSVIASKVLADKYVAGYVSEGEPPDAELFDVFTTGIVSPRVALFHKDQLVCSGTTPAMLTIVIIVSAVALVLALLVAFVIIKERLGKPIFMPLIMEAAKPQL